MKLDDLIQQPGQLERIQQASTSKRVHVSTPAKILRYDPDKRTVDVQPTIREWNSSEDPPVIQNVPVFFPGEYTYNINPGDECIVVFSDSCIDGWWYTGKISNPMVGRFHDLSDGFAIVGFRSLPNASRESISLEGTFSNIDRRLERLESIVITYLTWDDLYNAEFRDLTYDDLDSEPYDDITWDNLNEGWDRS